MGATVIRNNRWTNGTMIQFSGADNAQHQILALESRGVVLLELESRGMLLLHLCNCPHYKAPQSCALLESCAAFPSHRRRIQECWHGKTRDCKGIFDIWRKGNILVHFCRLAQIQTMSPCLVISTCKKLNMKERWSLVNRFVRK